MPLIPPGAVGLKFWTFPSPRNAGFEASGILAAVEDAVVVSGPTADSDLAPYSADNDIQTADAGASGATDTAAFTVFVGPIVTGTLAATEGAIVTEVAVKWADVGTSIVKSNGDLDATTASGWSNARGDTSHTTGKWYCEIEVLVEPGSGDNVAIGVCDATTAAGSGLESVGFPNCGGTRGPDGYNFTNTWSNNHLVSQSGVDWGSGCAVGTRFGIAANLDDRECYLAKDNVWTGSSNPSLGILPRITWPGFGGTAIYPFVAMVNGAKVRIHSTAANFTYTPPTGYSAWGTTVVQVDTDTVSFDGTVGAAGVTGTLAATEGDDVSNFTGLVGRSGTLTATTEATDTPAFTGQVYWLGTLAAIEGTDTSVFTGYGPSIGVLAATESAYELLLHFDGVDGSTTIIDDGGMAHVVTAHGGAQIDTSEFVFAKQALLVSEPTDYLTLDTGNYVFGVDDFCIDFRARLSSASFPQMFYNGGSTGPKIYYDGAVLKFNSTAGTITGSGLAADTNYHIAATRGSGSTRLWLDGVQQGSTLTDATSYGVTATYPRIGGG